MAKKLRTFVTVHERDEDGNPTGRSETFGPNDALPSWAEKAITNPDVWAEGDAQTSAETAGSDGGSGGSGGGQDGPPPKGGAGSGVQAWREYAARNNVEVPEGASRDDVVAALDAAGVRTE